MTIHLYLIRHAESENNARPEHERVEDPSITSRGVLQAERLADWFATHPFDLLVTSPFRRALQTAAPVANRTGRHVEIWCDIFERGGCYTGWRKEDLQGGAGLAGSAMVEIIPHALLETEISNDGWWARRPREADEEARNRATLVCRKLESRFGARDHRVAVITHAEFQRLLLGELIGNRDFADAGLGKIANAGITYLQGGEHGWQIQWFNSVTHLPSHLITESKG